MEDTCGKRDFRSRCGRNVLLLSMSESSSSMDLSSEALPAKTADRPEVDEPLRIQANIGYFYLIKGSPSRYWTPRKLEWLNGPISVLSREIVDKDNNRSGDQESLIKFLKRRCFQNAPDDCDSEYALKQWPLVRGAELVKAFEESDKYLDFVDKCFIRSSLKSTDAPELDEASAIGTPPLQPRSYFLIYHTATEQSWDQPYVGKAPEALWNHIVRQYNPSEESVYAHYAAIIQSSGMGKSRTVDEMGKKHFVIPVNLRNPGAQGVAQNNSCFVLHEHSPRSRLPSIGRSGL